MSLLAWVFSLVLGLGALFVGLDRISDGFTDHRRLNAVLDEPISSLDAVAYGRVAVEGRVVSEAVPKSLPLGGGSCVVADVAVTDTGSGLPKTLVEKRLSVPFVVETADGRIRIDAAAVTLDPSSERSVEHSLTGASDPPEAVADFDTSHGLSRIAIGHDREYEQSWVAPGDEVYVTGRAVLDDSGLETGVGDKPVVLTAGDEPCFVTDRSREQMRKRWRFSLFKSVSVGVALTTVGVVLLLAVSGIASLFV